MITTTMMHYALLVSGVHRSWTLNFESLELCELARKQINETSGNNMYASQSCIKIAYEKEGKE